MISRKVILIALVFIFLLLTFKGINTLDPDFGWHLRMGQLIIHSGIPLTDPFSYTMPSYPFVDHEWLTDVLLAQAYPLVGYAVLATIFSVLSFGTVYMLIGRPKNLLIFSIFVLSVLVVLRFQGVRPQVISWFFLALLLKLINSPKLKWLLPALFLVWVNLHGGWIFGIIVLTIFTGVKFMQEKRAQIAEIILLALSLGATLLNPYGLGIWEVVWESARDSSLHFRIGEWIPFVFSFHLASVFFLALSLCLFIRYFKKHSIWQGLCYLIFLLGGLLTSRNFPLWIVIALPVFAYDFQLFQEEISRVKFGKARLQALSLVLAGVVGSLALLETCWLGLTFLSVNKSVSYPQEAVSYLSQHQPDGQIFADYDWGGYLIWKLPEKKVFIDGRMPSWRRVVAPNGESKDAFAEFLQIQEHSETTQEIIGKYSISTILWPNPDYPPRDFFQLIREQIMGSDPPAKDRFLETLRFSGWREVYQDNIAVIYQRIVASD